MKAYSISEAYVAEARRAGFNPIDNMSVLLTHLSEVLRNNLAQLLSYKDMRVLFDRLGPEYKRLLDEISPSLISYSGLAGGAEIAARRAHFDPQSASHSRSHRRNRASCAARRTDRRTCAPAHGAADLRRSRPGRRR